MAIHSASATGLSSDYDSASQAKAALQALREKDIKNSDGRPSIVRENKTKARRSLEAPLVTMCERLLKLYGGDAGSRSSQWSSITIRSRWTGERFSSWTARDG